MVLFYTCQLCFVVLGIHDPKSVTNINYVLPGEGIKMTTKILRLLLTTFLLFTWSLSATSFASEIEKSHTLQLAIKGEPEEGYDPLFGWGRYGNPLFQSTLLKRDENLNIVQDLATNHSLSENGLLWTIKIRENAKFSNGQQLTAEDVVFTFNTAKTSGGKVDLSRMISANKTGDYSLTLKLSKPDSTFINRLITLGIVPHDSYSPTYGRNPIGSGPYLLREWQEGQQMIAEFNPYYYGEKPFFQRLVFLFTDEDTSFAAAKAGKIDVVVVPQILGPQEITGMILHRVASVDNRGLLLPSIPDTGKKTSEGYPIGNNVTSDIAIRKAINLAIDRKALVEGVLEGYGSPAFGVCDGMPWDNAANVFEDNNIDGAIKLLENAGWLDTDGDGIREKNGIKAEFNLVYPAKRSIRQYLALASADRLRKIGIEAHVLGKNSFDDIQKIMHRDVVVFGWGSHDPIELYHLYASEFSGIDYNNPGYYHNAKVDEYMEKALSATNQGDAFKYWKLSQWDGTTGSNFKGDAPWVWLVNLDHIYFINKNLNVGTSQIEPHGHGWPITANIEKWSWNK